MSPEIADSEIMAAAGAGEVPVAEVAAGVDVAQPVQWVSRAVLRIVESGTSSRCAECGDAITFKARQRKAARVICNIYAEGVWQDVEFYHRDCYDTAGQPYGPPDTSQPIRPKRPNQ